MSESKLLRSVALAVLAGGLAFAPGAAAAGTCKGHYHTMQGSSSAFQYLASVSAKNAWKGVVSGHDGGGFATWGKAKNKRVVCTKSGPGATWLCSARAQPCD